MKKKLFFFLQHISKDMHTLPSSFFAAVIPVGDQLLLDPWTASWISELLS